ncbi:MAG TPA: hypothetical protein VGR62_24370 [Candidatus Binatia bacterium]|jgi:DMSO/TMAO reductase YedYZ heme-binding membrane subunit|nr:hypothetical protein [Candidatus Binatia bacterium]
MPVVASATAVILALIAATLLESGTGEDGVRAVIRVTARTSVLLFAAAFAARPLRTLWKSSFTAWLRRRRRQVGLAFAVSHLLHLIAIVILFARWDASTSAVTLVFGGLGYVFILLMAVTSNDASVRWLGARRWSLLHTTGGYLLWIIFANSYIPRAIAEPAYAPLALLVVGTLVLRIVARRNTAPARLTPAGAARDGLPQ